MRDTKKCEAENLSKQVGKTLRRIRKERGISIKELSGKIEVSKLTLGNIERGEANPSLTVIWKIANGLNIPPSALLSSHEQVVISRYDTVRGDCNNGQAYSLELMYPMMSFSSSDVFRFFLKPNCEYHPKEMYRNEMQYVTVMDGEIIINIENESYFLKTFDALKFHGGKKHNFRNPTQYTTVLHFIMTCKDS